MARLESGWMPGVERVRSMAAGGLGVPEDAMYPQGIVQHVMAGYFAGARQMMQSSAPGTVGWHFSIARDGRVMQHASIWDTMQHAGAIKNPDPGAQTLINRFGNPNLWAIGIEHEGFSIPVFSDTGKRIDDFIYDQAHPWPEELITASIRVQRWVWNSCQWLIDLPASERQQRFVTHSMIDRVTRAQDPGDLWNTTVWHRVVNGALEPTPVPRPAPVTPLPAPTPPPVPVPVGPGGPPPARDDRARVIEALERLINELRQG